MISSTGVTPNPDKVKAIIDWHQPRLLMDLRGFLGLTGFYRNFVCQSNLSSRGFITLSEVYMDTYNITSFYII